MRIWHYLLENILSAKRSFLNYTNVNSCFVNYYSHSITEVDLLYQLLDVFTVEISINGLKPRFLNLPYFELSEVGIMFFQWFYLLTVQSPANLCYSWNSLPLYGDQEYMSLLFTTGSRSHDFLVITFCGERERYKQPWQMINEQLYNTTTLQSYVGACQKC